MVEWRAIEGKCNIKIIVLYNGHVNIYCITLLCVPFQKTLQNVTITEITGKDEALTVQDNGGNVMWIFEVSATVSYKIVCTSKL